MPSPCFWAGRATTAHPVGEIKALHQVRQLEQMLPVLGKPLVIAAGNDQSNCSPPVSVASQQLQRLHRQADALTREGKSAAGRQEWGTRR
jgi:hypothetical protein